MIDNIKVGRTIAMLRQERGMTQQQLAAALSVSHQAVSKWEKGAALPDIQTMMELTHLFGITVEQLISGDIPKVEENCTIGKKIDEHLQNIGSFVSDVAGSLFGQAPVEDAAFEAEEPVHAPEDEAVFNESECEEEKQTDSKNETFDVQKLLRMAPFMSKAALDSILLENRDKLTPDDISRFAPFVSKDTLGKLIQDSDDEINWETLQRVAPFLKREMVDALAKAAAKGERLVKKVVNRTENTTSDFEKSLEDVSQRIGAGMGKVAKHAIRFGEELVDGLAAVFGEQTEESPMKTRAQVLRNAAIERAAEDGKWDWVASRLADVQDEALRGRIAQKAIDQGMQEWLKANLPEYAQVNDAESVLGNEQWDAIAEYLPRMDAGYRMRAALRAANAGEWAWLVENIAELEFGDKALQIAMLACEEGMTDEVTAIAEKAMNDEDIKALVNAVIEKGNYELAVQLSRLAGSDFFEEVCIKLAGAEKWDLITEFLPITSVKSIETLMELAISQGNFGVIDILDDYLG